VPTQRILVCGASGFLGQALCVRLADEAGELHALSRVARVSDPRWRWWQADLTDIGAAERIISDIRPDIVFNVSGISDGSPDCTRVAPLFVGNALSTVALLAAAARHGCQRFIHCSTLQEPDFQTSRATVPSAYGLSKFVGSAYVELFGQVCALAGVVLRLGIVFGPGEEGRHRLIPYVITSLLRGERPRLSSGQQPVDWLYIEDAVDALIAGMRAPGAAGQSFNIGAGVQRTVADVVGRIVRLIDNGVTPLFGTLADRPLVPTREAEPARLLTELNWRPRTTLDDGLAATIEWYRHRLA
jgi:nucleoside-diphosphate-sugar epimerase